MGLENCQIFFDNPNATYNAGDIVSGKVEFNFNSTKKIRGISISFKGEARVHWSESESYRDSDGKSKSRSVSYNGSEEYFTHKYFVVGGATNDSIQLPLGKHVFPFSTSLPNFLPSSFEGDKGYIRYTVKATLDRPWKFDQSIKAAFTVLSPLDCNNNPRAREPAALTMEKYLCCLCCREGPITGILKIPCTGYVSGQVIPYTIEIDNASRTDVQEIKLKLRKIVSYHSQVPRSKTKKTDVTVAEFVVGQTVTARDSKTFSNNFMVPALPPSNLQNCRIIDLEYELKVQIDIDGFHQNMVGNIPIVIGTIPLANMIPLSAFEENSNAETETAVRQPLVGWIPNVALPTAPVDPYLLPPPTYEECQFGTKSILDASDSEFTRLNNDRTYAPSYPVYNFTTMPAPGSSTLPYPVPTQVDPTFVPSAPLTQKY